MSRQNIYIYLDGKPKPPLELDLSNKLNKVREKIKGKYGDNFIFLNNEDEIPLNEEEGWELNHIASKKNDQFSIHIKTKINNSASGSFTAPVERKSLYVKNLVSGLNKSNEEQDKKIMPIKGSKLLYTKTKDMGKKSDDDFVESKQNVKLNIYQYPTIEFTKEEEGKVITILVIGETGSGKTTLINSFVNAAMEITLGLNFRYIIVSENHLNLSQAHSQTQDATIYNIRAKDGKCIQIVDTPGYGDARGISQDRIITQKISKLFKEKLNYINAICFVARSSSPRLTPTQKYIFHSILELFGEDVMSNFIAMLTFCDAEEPQVLSALEEPGSVYDKIIPHVEKPYYYTFNNSAFFSVNFNDFTTMFWNLGMRSFTRFIKRLEKLPKKTLNQTREVINERKKLESLIEILQNKLTDALNKVAECKEYYRIISDLKRDIKDSENFTKVIKVPSTEKIDLPQGRHTTTCLICNLTCHKNCYYANNEDKKHCCAMDGNGNCRRCEKNCIWSQHVNTPYIIQSCMIEKKITLDELKQKYDDSQNKIFNKKKMLDNIMDNILSLNNICIETQEEITKCINKLKKIALNKDILSSEQHIEILIQSEKMEQKEGFMQRVEALELLKKQKRLMREAYQNKIPSLQELKKFLEKTYEIKKKEDKSQCFIY